MDPHFARNGPVVRAERTILFAELVRLKFHLFAPRGLFSVDEFAVLRDVVEVIVTIRPEPVLSHVDDPALLLS